MSKTKSAKTTTRPTNQKSTTKKCGITKRRRSPRNIQPEGTDDTYIKQEISSQGPQATQEPTPPSSPEPMHDQENPQSKPITTAINQRSDRLESKYTVSAPSQKQDSQGPSSGQSCNEVGQARLPTVNWDCTSYVVSDQKVQTSYEKPEMSNPQLDPNGKPIPNTSRVQAYGKMVTKTVTVTVTTTFATTEILRPGEPGYEESLERQKRQREQGPEEKQKQERQYRESRKWASGDKTMHENFHYTHHRAAQPAPSTAV